MRESEEARRREEERITYAMAQENEALRQRYLDGINLDTARSAIKRVLYDPSLQEIHPLSMWQAAMEVSPNIGAQLGLRGVPSVVHIGPHAFTMEEKDFLSSLLRHEARHAQDVRDRPHTIFTPTWRTFLLHFFGKPTPEGYPYPDVLHEKRLKHLSERRAIHAQLMAHRTGEMPISDREYRTLLTEQESHRFASRCLRNTRTLLGRKTSLLRTLIVHPMKNLIRKIREDFRS